MQTYSETVKQKREIIKAGAYGFNYVQRVNMLNLIGFVYKNMKVKNPDLTVLDVFNKIESGRVDRKIFPTKIDDDFKFPLCAEIEVMLELDSYFVPTNYGLKSSTEIVAAINKLLDDAYVPF